MSRATDGFSATTATVMRGAPPGEAIPDRGPAGSGKASGGSPAPGAPR